MSFLGSAGPPNPPRPPQTPPMVQGGQKWLKCTCTSPVLIINDKKTTFGGMNILTYFFTRNVPPVRRSTADSLRAKLFCSAAPVFSWKSWQDQHSFIFYRTHLAKIQPGIKFPTNVVGSQPDQSDPYLMRRLAQKSKIRPKKGIKKVKSLQFISLSRFCWRKRMILWWVGVS